MSAHSQAGKYVGSLRASRQIGGLELAETEYGPGLVVPSHAHDNPLAFLLLGGGMTEERGWHRFLCGPGSLIYHPSHEPHGHRFHEAGGRCLVLQFHDPWRERLERVGLTHPTCPLDQERSRAGWLAQQIHRELHAPDSAAELAIEGYAVAMLGELARGRQLRERSARPGWLIRVVELLHERSGAAVSMAGIAAEVDVHPTHLARAFRQHYGCTMGEYLRRIRIDCAREALLATDRPLSEIALEAGFADQAHFSRVFRAAVGETPGTFRRAVRAGKSG